MSYILDALRKSEQERQIAAGRGAGMLYPATVERPPKSAMRIALLGGSALAAALMLVWWAWPRPSPAPVTPDKVVATTAAAPRAAPVAQPVPKPAATEQAASRKVLPEPVPLVAENIRPVTVKAHTEAAPKKNSAPVVAATGPVAAPTAPVASKNEALDEMPRGLPHINISGYINDEQGAKLAIINDKLLREGDEVTPGLRLEKIIGENAVFSYKGQRFRR